MNPAAGAGGRPIGVLLVNLGTPDAPRTSEVRRYLRQFLSDSRVVDIPPVARWLLLNLVILPLRPSRSAAAYRKIWTMQGSPLLIHGRRLAEKVQEALGGGHEVVLAMRYGEPSILRGLDALRRRGADPIIVFPLFPQNASSSTGSALEEVYRRAGSPWKVPALRVVPPFYDDPGFIEALRRNGAPILADLRPERVLFSFHGVPERHVFKGDPTGRHCLRRPDCCDRILADNRDCYRAQCHSTARRMAAALDLGEGSWTVTFQSRLGNTPWIRPHTDVAVRELAEAGVRRLAVFCPSFVADCLETIEEIGLRAREAFLAHGGEDLRLVPSLNAHPAWVETVVRLVRAAADPG